MPKVATIRGLSIRQPWACRILEGTKPIEYRSWSTRYRGPLLILGGKVMDKDAPGLFADCEEVDHRGAILGMVDLVGVSPPRVGEDCFRWNLARPRRLARPVPWKGTLGLMTFNVHEVEGLAELLRG